MTTLREIKQHMGSVSSIAKVTNAMQVVAAAQHERLRGRVQSVRAFAESSWAMLCHLAASSEELQGEAVLYGRPQVRSVALIVVSSDRGMAGGYDQAVVTEAQRWLATQSMPIRLITIGSYGRDAMARLGFEAHKDLRLPTDISLAWASPIADRLLQDFADGLVDGAYLTYTECHGGARFSVVTRQLLPVAVTEVERRQYIHEPEPSVLFSELLPIVLRAQVYQAVLESMASETAARMMAMRSATRNAEELIEDLRIAYNKARQQAITNEMLDIMGGSTAVRQVRDVP